MTEISADSLIKTAMNVLYSYPDSARSIIIKAIIADSLNEKHNHSGNLNLLGSTYNVQDNYGQALNYYYKALESAQQHNDTVRLGAIYNNIGVLYLKTGNFKDALDYYLKALERFQRSGSKKNAAGVYNNIGLLFNELENSEKALINFQLALENFKLVGDSIGISTALGNKGLMFAKKMKVDSAHFYFDKAAGISQRNDNIYGLCSIYQDKANFYLKTNNTIDAKNYYSLSRTLSQSIIQPYQEASSMLGLAQVLLKEGNLSNALDEATAALEIGKQLNNQVLQYESHNVLSQIYEKNGSFDKSLQHFRQYVTMKDELLNQTVLHQIYNLEINTLSQANTFQQLQIESQQLSISKKNNLLLFIGIAFLLVIIGIYLLYHNYKHKQQVKLQQAIIDLTEKKSRDAVSAEIQERQRIGRELHDGLGQVLSVARLNLSVLHQKRQLTDSRKEELFDTTFKSIDEAFTELRNISHNLAPTLLSEKGLIEALKNLSDIINKTNHLKMQVESFGFFTDLDNLTEHTIYRAIQELLNNAIKHAEASLFTVQLIKSEKEVTLMVEDNGHGFNVNDTGTNNGGGIGNIKSRVENLNGSMYVDSLIDRGTIVSIVIPLK
ncbi:MAG: sensor histidine kinase [Lentimicrobiaceae bacterium]|jgi:signal transduction histidine kinase|nr:sensor histidine kinase [Lentimicrobiaceae bacterium]MDY0026253.1 sensor histidine kinase [Lentimicrobium sp.]